MAKPARIVPTLSAKATHRLAELITLVDPLGRAVARASGRQPTHRLKPRRPQRDLRLPPPGTMLSRWYKGREISVRIVEIGFEWEGRRYPSLSAIAGEVTGVHWNGLLFFGIVHQEKKPAGRRLEP